MSEISLILDQIGREIKLMADPDSYIKQKDTPRHSGTTGRNLTFDEMITEGLDQSIYSGALKITYCKGKFMTVDRIQKKQDDYHRLRRIIYDLTSKSGQISASILLEILQIDENNKFSKHHFLRRIEKEYFRDNGVLISSGELNETFSRMLRRTFDTFFEIDGRYFVHKNYFLKMEEIFLNEVESYQMYRHRITRRTNDLMHELKVTPS